MRSVLIPLAGCTVRADVRRLTITSDLVPGIGVPTFTPRTFLDRRVAEGDILAIGVLLR